MRHAVFSFIITLAASPAFAQGVGTNPEGDPLVSLLPFLFIFAIFYFLLIRPQQKRMKAHQEMVKAIKKGDEVTTAGGIIGKVTSLEGDEHVMLQIASGVEVKAVKATLSQVQPKPEASQPAHKDKAAREKNDNSAPEKARIANDN